MTSQTEIFRRRVFDCLGTPPPTVPVTTTLADAVDCLRETQASGLVLVDADNRPAGLLTEADIARRVAFSQEPDAPVSAVMTSPVVSIGADEHLYRAVARMRKNTLRHLPVTDEDGCLAGMLHLDDALASVSQDLVTRIDRLSSDGDEVALRSVKQAQTDVAADLLADNLPATDVLDLITYINNDLYRRAARSVLDEMLTAPPVDFALIVMGSGGRGENFLYPDQDNGLVIADYPDADHTRIDDWFIDFSARLTARMDSIGLPFCNGYVMATNPLWRKTISQWLAQLDLWIRHQPMAALLLADIFFDFAVVAGNRSLAAPVRDWITRRMPKASIFLNGMVRQHDHTRSALGLFGRFRTVPDGTGTGVIDLKRSALQPTVAAIRLLALKNGISETGTLERISGLADKDVLSADDADEIAAAFGDVCDILLRAQLVSVQAGQPVTNRIAPSALRRARRRELRAALRSIDTLTLRVHSEFTGTTL